MHLCTVYSDQNYFNSTETSWDKDEPKGDEEMSAPDIGHDIKGTDRQMEWHLELLT